MMKRLILFLVLSITVGVARAQVFDYSINTGLTMSQIDGDGSGHYNRFGFHVAVNTTFPLSSTNDSFRMLVEIGLTQKGSTITGIDRQIGLTYVELPLLLTGRFPVGEVGSIRVGGGIAPAYLAKVSVKDGGVTNRTVEENYRTLDRLPLCLDVLYMANRHMGLGVRYYNSMLSVTHEESSGTYRVFRSNKGVFNRNILVYLNYKF